jgi:hypothetical protein
MITKNFYLKTVEFQKFLQTQGIAWHNPFSDECTNDFECCCGGGDYKHYFPSYEHVVKNQHEEMYRKNFSLVDEDQEIKKILTESVKEYFQEF